MQSPSSPGRAGLPCARSGCRSVCRCSRTHKWQCLLPYFAFCCHNKTLSKINLRRKGFILDCRLNRPVWRQARIRTQSRKLWRQELEQRTWRSAAY